MIIIPAIDIIDGKPVRLYKGEYDKKEIVGVDVLDIGIKFQNLGAKFIHIVDLDGAKEGYMKNKELILKLAKTLNTPIEVGGGIRNLETVKELIEGGIERVILGTSAIEDKKFLKEAVINYGDKIAVGIDCKDGYAYGRGWLAESSLHYIEFARELQKLGVKNIIVTDISRDGTLEGVNVSMLKELKEEVDINITASGGVKDIEDIKALKEIDVYGAITGKAIYKNTLSLKESIELSEN